MPRINRRELLGHTMAGAIAATASEAWSQPASSTGPNDRLQGALIGVGGRSRS